MIQIFETIDMKILVWIHNNHNDVFDLLMPFITNSDNWIFPILILVFVLGFKAGKKGRIALVLLIICLAITDSICAQVLKPIIARIRPSHLSIDSLNLLVSKGGKWSMPSNHAANMFAFSVILSYFYEKIRIPLFCLATLIAISRVYVGVHYLGDVIIGSILGYSMGWIILTIWVIIKIRELKRRKIWVWYEGEPPIFKN